jgi:hypothetical protein
VISFGPTNDDSSQGTNGEGIVQYRRNVNGVNGPTSCFPNLHTVFLLTMEMRTLMRLARLLLGIACVSVTLVAADFAGTWKLNLTKSQGRSDLDSQIMKIEQTGPNMYRTTIDVVFRSGQKQHQEINRVYDGKEHPATGVGIAKGGSEICQYLDPSTHKVTQKRDGKQISEFTSSISADGKVMTNHRTGNREETLVFERQ